MVGTLSIGLYAAAIGVALGAHVDYVDTDAGRLAAAEKLGAIVHDVAKPDKSWDPYPVTVNTTADPALLVATLRATWPDGVCTDTGIYYEQGRDAVAADVHPRCEVCHRAGQCPRRHPGGACAARRGMDLAPAVDRVVPWEDAPSAWPEMTGKTVFTRA